MKTIEVNITHNAILVFKNINIIMSIDVTKELFYVSFARETDNGFEVVDEQFIKLGENND